MTSSFVFIPIGIGLGSNRLCDSILEHLGSNRSERSTFTSLLRIGLYFGWQSCQWVGGNHIIKSFSCPVYANRVTAYIVFSLIIFFFFGRLRKMNYPRHAI